MRIVQIVTQMEGGGAQRCAIVAAREMRYLGHEVETWFMFRRRGVYDDEPHTRCLHPSYPESAFDYVRILWKLFRELSRARADAVITYTRYSNIIGCFFAALLGVKKRVARKDELHENEPFVIRFMDGVIGSLGVYTTVLAVSNAVAKAFEAHPISYRKRIRVIYNGVELPTAALTRDAAREHYGIGVDEFVYLAVGRLHYVKNCFRLVRAVAQVENVRLVVAGDGEYKQDLLREVKLLGIEDRVTYLGDIKASDVGSVYAAADALVHPSVIESFGLVPLEASSMGLPMAISRIPAFVEVVGEDNALFFDPLKVDDIADRMRELHLNSDLRKTLSKRSLNLADKYKTESMTGQMLELVLPD